MKWIIKILFTIALLVGGYSVLLNFTTGSANSTVLSHLPNPSHLFAKLNNWLNTKSQKAGRAAGIEHSGESKMYRWVDANGETHIANVPPEGVEYEIFWIDPNQSLLNE